MKKRTWIITLAAILLFIISHILIFPVETVSGTCMNPLIPDGYKIVYNRLAYIKKSPERGDVITFYHDDVVMMKRIIGMPGDRIDFNSGDVFINGTYVYEEYAKGLTLSAKSFEVPAGKYFVMGDNREEAYDSRFWSEPYIEEGDILGKVILTYSLANLDASAVHGTTLSIINDGTVKTEVPEPVEETDTEETETETETEEIEMETEAETETETETETEIAIKEVAVGESTVLVTPVGKSMNVTANGLNVRALPNEKAERVDVLKLDTEVSVIGECDNEWYEIELGEGKIGYVKGDYVK